MDSRPTTDSINSVGTSAYFSWKTESSSKHFIPGGRKSRNIESTLFSEKQMSTLYSTTTTPQVQDWAPNRATSTFQGFPIISHSTAATLPLCSASLAKPYKSTTCQTTSLCSRGPSTQTSTSLLVTTQTSSPQKSSWWNDTRALTRTLLVQTTALAMASIFLRNLPNGVRNLPDVTSKIVISITLHSLTEEEFPQRNEDL